MSPPEAIQQRAQAIADDAMRQQRAQHGYTAQIAVLNHALERLMEQGLEAQRVRNGRSLTIFETDFAVIAALADALMEGNYRDTAARLAGVAESGVRAWLKAADDGDERYAAVANVIRIAEAVAESETVGNVRNASKLPQFWAAGMTWLERKYPEKYGRRPEDSSTPRVIVQVGGHASDVKVLIASEPPPTRFTCSMDGDVTAALPATSPVAEMNATHEPRSDAAAVRAATVATKKAHTRRSAGTARR